MRQAKKCFPHPVSAGKDVTKGIFVHIGVIVYEKEIEISLYPFQKEKRHIMVIPRIYEVDSVGQCFDSFIPGFLCFRINLTDRG